MTVTCRFVARHALLPLCALAGLLVLAAPATAQPFGGIFSLSASNPGYIDIPQSPALNPASTITIEFWVGADSQPTDSVCKSLVGKDWHVSYWVGICGASRTLRSYLRGSTSLFDGGAIPLGELTHIAVTFDGATRRHYINGELVASQAETGSLPASTADLRIGSDFNYNFVPNASFSEVRLWSVARTIDQIRSTINVQLSTPQPGLVAAWGFGAADNLHGHNGSVVGHFSALDLPIAPNCGSLTSTALCLNNRFSISAVFRTGPPGSAETQAHTVNLFNPGSGLFWFFGSDNWEVMVKSIPGCGITGHWWIYTAATTDQFYRLTVYDIHAGAQKIYFNYPGQPAPAVTDSSAFATCP
ncbi:MAG: LamG domain-containing protein [Thermoanaerobaculia bacterium]